MSSQAAGLSLARLVRIIDSEENTSLQEWLAGHWPALFANKPFSVAADLRAFCEDRSASWFIRINIMEAVLAMHDAQGEAQLSEALAWVANLIQSDDEDFDLCCHAGCLLLNFPRPEYRQQLENLGDLQRGIGAVFFKSDVQRAYSEQPLNPPWERIEDPWKFYSPESIAERQDLWAHVDSRREARELRALRGEDDSGRSYDFNVPTFVRETPKIGRNDPCHCGSGNKYKKCCLTVDSNVE